MAEEVNRGISRVPAVGAPVFTRDGAALGEVKEVEADYFKVDASMMRDYWLSSEFVLASNPALVELDFDAEVLEDYKLEAPGPAITASPTLDAEAETFASVEEKHQRREEMQRGYGRHTEGPSIF